MIDNDSFNNINTLHGYNIGEEVLKKQMLISFSKKYPYNGYRLYSNTFALLGTEKITWVDKYQKDINNLLTQYTKITVKKHVFGLNNLDIVLD